MNIKIEKFNFSESIQVQALTKWDCDRELFHLATPVPNEKMALEYPSEFEVIKKYQDSNFAQGVYIIWDNDKPIGNLSIQVDPPHLMKKVSGTSWLGLIIGEKEYWGTGAAVIAMKFFEDQSLRLGLKRIELGTFEFNIRAQNFYKKLGYTEIGRLKNFTYYNNRFWDDIRMEKILRS
jgi:RimJ/RimL family protein N-acetyltransferase